MTQRTVTVWDPPITATLFEAGSGDDVVYLHAAGPEGELAQDFVARGGREDVRRRAAVSALHLVRRLLTQSLNSPA